MNGHKNLIKAKFVLLTFLLNTNIVSAQSISGGDGHSLAICADGFVQAWGENANGQLGNTTQMPATVPVEVSSALGGDIIAVSGGQFHTLFLKKDGTVWGVGNNGYGELGAINNSATFVPVQIPDLENIIAVSAGGSFSLFLKSDGTVWSSGLNAHGQLGDGTEINRTTPVQIPGLSDIISVSAGFAHSVFLKSDGTVWTCGSNDGGQMGDGSFIYYHKSTATKITGLSNITAISAGGYFWSLSSVINPYKGHSLFLKNDGTVWACGDNTKGQLGTAQGHEHFTPFQINGLNSIIAISAGGIHSLFLKSDGTVLTCGYNNSGQLGDGSTTDRNTPVQAINSSNIIYIEAGRSHSLFLKSNGTVLACGNNFYGQVGDGTNNNQSTPTQVDDLCVVSVNLLSAPTNLTATPVNSIELNWQDNSNNEDGFYIESTQDSSVGNWVLIDTVLANVTTYLHLGLNPGEDYYYRVRAFNSQGTSQYSNVAGATDGPTGTARIIPGNSISVYPNPVTNTLTINVQESTNIRQLTILDFMGRMVNDQILNRALIATIDMSHYPSGIYFVKVVFANGQHAIKMVTKE